MKEKLNIATWTAGPGMVSASAEQKVMKGPLTGTPSIVSGLGNR